MDSYIINEWITLIVRWIHVFAAIMWVGNTYLFNFLEGNLEKSDADSPNIIGRLWMVHGGGFYHVEKQHYPQNLPNMLHWFKWEAAITWISGAILITMVYYMGGLLVEPDGDYTTGVFVGCSTIICSWVIYDILVQSPLGKNDFAIGIIGFIGLLGIAYFLPIYLSSRATFIHVGAVMGTLMTANVWMRILPSQKKLIAAAQKGETISNNISTRGPQRSKHNSYMAIPLVLIMLSNHYPIITYGNDNSVLILGIILIVGFGVAKKIRG